MIAALVGGHAEPAFDQGEVLAVLAKKARRQPIVVEREHDLGRAGALRLEAAIPLSDPRGRIRLAAFRG